MTSDSDYFAVITPSDPKKLNSRQLSDWLLLFCWSLWFPQIITAYVRIHVDPEVGFPRPTATPGESWLTSYSRPLLAWWHNDRDVDFLTFSIALALIELFLTSVVFSIIVGIQSGSVLAALGIPLLALVMVIAAMVVVAAVAAEQNRIDAFGVVVILFAPALFLIAIVLAYCASRDLFPSVLISFLMVVPYGIAAGSLFALLGNALPRTAIALKYAPLVAVTVFICSFYIYAIACDLPPLVLGGPSSATIACPQENVLRSVFFRSLGTAAAVVLGMALGALRLDDWLISHIPSLPKIRRCNQWQGPRVSPIPEPGLRARLQRSLQADWLEGLHCTSTLWQWTNQHITVVRALQQLFVAYEKTGQEATAFGHLRHAADHHEQFHRQLQALRQQMVFKPSGTAQWFEYEITEPRYGETIAGFQALLEGKPNQAAVAFPKGLRGELAREYVQLSHALAALTDRERLSMQSVDPYGPDFSPNDRAEVWRAIEAINHCREQVEVVSELRNRDRNLDVEGEKLKMFLHVADQASDLVGKRKYLESQVVQTIVDGLITEYANLTQTDDISISDDPDG